MHLTVHVYAFYCLLLCLYIGLNSENSKYILKLLLNLVKSCKCLNKCDKIVYYIFFNLG